MRLMDAGTMFGMSTARIFNSWKPEVYKPRSLKEYEQFLPQADLILFGGGQDVDPSLYGHSNYGSHTQGPSVRDRMEQVMFRSALAANKPMLGICRGAQFVCIMAGGSLVQDVGGHGLPGDHKITTVDGLTLPMSSVHHQMMIPGKTVHELLAWTNSLTLSRAGRMPQWDTSKVLIGLDFFKQEPEVVYFPKVNALAIQGHPEFMDEASKAVDYTQQLVRQKLFKEDIVIRLKENSVED